MQQYQFEEESTASQELSEQDSASDTTPDDTEESKTTETLQVHNVCNKLTMMKMIHLEMNM